MRRLLTLTAVAVPLLLVPAAAQAAPAGSTARPAAGTRTVTPLVETPALYDDEAGGDANADDPAIWVNERDRGASRVIATAKNGGLRVYDLAGRERQAIATPPAPGEDDEAGRFNNVDLVQ